LLELGDVLFQFLHSKNVLGNISSLFKGWMTVNYFYLRTPIPGVTLWKNCLPGRSS